MLDPISKIQPYTYLDPKCVRKKSNSTTNIENYKFENPTFNKIGFNTHVKHFSPKLDRLLHNIEQLDKRDLETDGHLYKHFIFSDIKNYNGTKLISSGLIAKDFNLGYRKQGAGISLLDDAELKKAPYNNFYLLSSVGVYKKPINVKTKKQILEKFNSRPDNVYGEKARIIVMDSGFKEGIDLFDIKYIHIFEPAVSIGDQRQIIGRGTRYCGQKGLIFHPTRGWPLNVFLYDLEIDEAIGKNLLDSSSGIELYLKTLNININMATMVSEFERMLIYGAVDYDLTRNVHSAKLIQDGGALRLGGSPPESPTVREEDAGDKFKQMRDFVKKNFSQYTWPEIKMENLCGYEGPERGAAQTGGAAPIYVNYTQTQAFIQNYFTPQNPIKGMLLNHSVGTGKTCTAIATASKSFEEQGYTILWVTRTTLKNDIWKNMFDLVCHQQFQNRHAQIGDEFKIPAAQEDRMKLLSKAWRIRPISYKQFTNLVSKKNEYYKKLVEINGEEDPLRRTLLIIDEAHKLYGATDISSIERPDTEQLHAALMNSYMVSGADSVKLLLMTATPIINSPMELIQLLNLCKLPGEQIETNLDTFSAMYFDETGKFTEKGERNFLNQIAGHVSYLNRERDARQFSQPVIKKINIPIVDPSLIKHIDMFDTTAIKNEYAREIQKYTSELEDAIIQSEENGDKVKQKFFAHLKEKCETMKKKAPCNKIVATNIKLMTEEINDTIKQTNDRVKKLKDTIKTTRGIRRGTLKRAAEYVEKNQVDYAKYMHSPYYHINAKCFKKVKDDSTIKEYLKQYPAMIELEKKLAGLEERAKDIDIENKLKIAKMKNYVKSIQRVLNNPAANLSDEQRKVYESFLESETKNLAKNIKDAMEASKYNKGVISDKKTIIKKTRSALKKKLIKTAKLRIKERNKEEKRLKRLKKDIVDINLNDNASKREIIERYTKKIDHEIEELLDNEAAAAEAKEAAKEAKKAAAAEAKEKKAAEKAAAAEAKKAAAAAAKTKKAAEKAAEKAAKAAAKTRKAK